MTHHIQSTESVSIHVRRGDYLDPIYEGKFDLLRDDYYRAAVARMKEIYEKPHFFIFSDDKDFIKEAFDWIPAEERTIVNGNTGSDSWKDMYLMSNFEHAIIANSTFSWWAAWLNLNPNKLVFVPSPWHQDHWGGNTVTPENWI